MNSKKLNIYEGCTRVLQAAALYPLRASDFPKESQGDALNMLKRGEAARTRIVIAKALGIDDADLATIISRFQDGKSNDQLHAAIKLAIMGAGEVK